MHNMYQQINALPNLEKVTIQKIISTRENQILELISHGLSTKDISKKLFLSKSTIESHRQNLLNKMDCKNVAQLIRRGFELKLLTATL